MKKILSTIAIIILIATLCATFSSCSSSSSAGNPIDFGKKYVNGDDYYVFNADGTGYLSKYYNYVYEKDSSYNFTLSGFVDFKWIEASNGAIYLIETGQRYNNDHTVGKTIAIIDEPIYFHDECFVRSYVSGGNSNIDIYVKEGTKLAKDVKNVEK